MNKKLVIGIGGLARSGKDTLCNMLIQQFYLNGYKAKRRALADELKVAIHPSILKQYRVDIFNCTPEEKELVRPEMVAYGKELREKTMGTHWTSLVEEKMKDDEENFIIVPDVRYNFYPEDEVNWVKKKHKGLLLHVARYNIVDGEKVWVQPPNEDERIHDPLVRKDADISFSWPTKDTAELQQMYGEFLQTIAQMSIHEFKNAER